MIQKTILSLLVCVLVWPALAFGDVFLTPKEIRQALSHGPWPPSFEPDPSNRVSGDPAAIKLGETLFFDPTLSKSGDMACTTCHQAERSFTDGLPRAQGQVELNRNTQALWNLRTQRWFGWSGDTDSIWAQSLTPLFNEDEMGHDPASLHLAMTEGRHASAYEAVFGDLIKTKPMDAAVNVSKALAAYIETLTTGVTSFDKFRDALARGDMRSAAAYPSAAQRGLKTFLGHGRCAFCHSGPAFSNGEFHDAGVPYFLERGRVDAGRFAGIQSLKESAFTLAGPYNDDPAKSGAWAVNNVRFQHSNFGVFRVPTLRRAAQTSPYMHDGSIPQLVDVLEHYNNINTERLHADGEAILRPLALKEEEIRDLLAFLRTLADD